MIFAPLSPFSLFTLSMGLSWQEYWSGLPFPLPVDHILPELSTMMCLSHLALYGMAHSFIELCKPLCHDKAVIRKASILWPPDVESQLIGIDADAGKD